MTLTDAERCTATCKATGTRCKRRHSPGLNVCVMHGGGSKMSRAKSARFLAENKIRKSLDTVEVREVTDPLAEFSRLVSEVVTWKDALAVHVAALNEYRFTDAKGGEQLRAEVALWERAMVHAGKLLETWVRLGLDTLVVEMHVRVTKIQVDELSRGVEAGLGAIQVRDDERKRFFAAMAKSMRS